MSQNTTRRKRVITSQNAAGLPKSVDENDVNSCENRFESISKKLENKTSNGFEITGFKKVSGSSNKLISSKATKNESTKISREDSLIPRKRIKVTAVEGVNYIDPKKNKDKNGWSPGYLSVLRHEKSPTSFRNSKVDIFNNITCSFDSSKVISLQGASVIGTQKRLELSSWGLPTAILEKYEARGIKSMFPWQMECLANKKVLENNRNLVYSAPTSAGKTLVAEFLVFKTVLERRKKAIFILPFVSVVREKMFYFQDLLSDSGVRVEGFMGGVAPAGGFASVHIAIATIEKANSLINRLMEENNLDTLGAVVIDELHLLGDPGRGYLLELLLTKLKYMSVSFENINIQLIGMSATLPNLPLIAEWLDAELYKTEFRPIPLNEQCKIGNHIFDSKLNVVRELEPAPDIVDDADNIIQLCIETINGGHGTLIFCPTKIWCEKLALQMSKMFFKLGRDNTPHGQILRKNIRLSDVEEILAQLKRCPVGLDSVLRKTVSFGVAFHHAGLTMDERDIIEGAFRIGSIKVLIATSTLSSGVNLPARRVIIRSPLFGGRPLDRLTYQQMIGRAGRMGKDTAGESILICPHTQRPTAINLMSSSLEPIVSCLEDSGPLIRALLEAIASKIVRTQIDLSLYCNCTFVYKCEKEEIKELVEDAIRFLVSNEFLLLKNIDGKDQRMVATCLGKACLSASIPPRDGLFLFEELQRARKCFVLDTELHVVYLVTPFSTSSQIGTIDWMIFMDIWKNLSESERRVGQLVGVEERFLVAAVRGVYRPGKTLNIHRRFFTALALHDLVREIPLNAVCKKYNCCRGQLQSLQQSSSTFAGMVTNFCKELKWDCMEILFAQFQTRLQFGVCRDLLDLLRLPSLNGLRARSLFKHGITTVSELAVANEVDVEMALNKALPFESERDFDGDNEAEIARKTKMRTVFITGKDGMTAHEAACVIIKEARVLVKNELGVRDVQWSQLNQSNATNINSTSFNNRINFKSPSLIGNLSNSRDLSPMSNQTSLNLVTNISPDVRSRVENNPVDVQNVSVEVHALNNLENIEKCDDKALQVEQHQNYDDIPNVYLEKTNADVSKRLSENINRVSDGNDMFSTSEADIINKSDKPETSSQTLHSKLIEKTKSLPKAQFSIRSMDFEDDNFFELDKLPNNNQITTPKIDQVTPKIDSRVLRSKFAKKSKSQIPISSIDFVEEINFSIEKADKNNDLANIKNNSKVASKTLEYGVAEKTQNLSKIDHITVSSIDFREKIDSRIEKSVEHLNDKNKLNTVAEAVEPEFVEKVQNFSKSDHFTLCTIDFQDEIDVGGEKLDHNNDRINKDSKSQKASRVLRSNVTKKTTQSLLNDEITLCSLDFKSNVDLCIEKSVKNTQNRKKVEKSPINEESLLIDQITLGEVTQTAENKKHSFTLPTNLPPKRTSEELKRQSEVVNCSESPSLFSDSSFLDGKMCSILEKNVIEGSDLEKTFFLPDDESNKIENLKKVTQSNSSIDNIVRTENSEDIKSISTAIQQPTVNKNKPNAGKSDKPLLGEKTKPVEVKGKSNPKESMQSIMRMTWAEDSWDQTKNILPNEIETNKNIQPKEIVSKISGSTLTSGSPSLLTLSSRTRSRLKPLTSKSVLNDQQPSTSKQSNSPLTNTPKSILKKRDFDRKVSGGSPIAAFRSCNSRKSILTGSPSSIKSDSEDSIVCSQSAEVSSARVNKTRIRIEQKILNTQKKLKKSKSKVVVDSAPMLVRQNSEPIFEDSSDTASVESDTMFDSDIEEKVIEIVEKKEKKSLVASKSFKSGSSVEEEPLKFSAIEPQNVANSKRLFRVFLSKIFSNSGANLRKADLAVSFVTVPYSIDSMVSIGSKIVGVNEKKKSKKNDTYIYGCKKICGIIVSWGIDAIYFIPFSSSPETKVTVKERMKFVKNILTNPSISLRCFNAKEVYKIFFSCCEIESSCKFLDPKIGDWMINSEDCNKNCNELTAQYFPRGLNISKNFENSTGTLVQLETIRASAKAVLAWYITGTIINVMKERSPILLSAFKDIEMPTNIILACMELRGFGINIDALKELSAAVRTDMTSIEEKAFNLAGRKFNFNSSKEVAQVLGMNKKGRACTNKKALMTCENPISNLVTLWRKLSTVQIKIIYPLLQLEKKNNRIHGNCITRTVTGRVSMYEPNLQTIPRDFKSDISGCTFSVRMAFIPIEGNVMLAADFCQLELRILAHFSKDPILCKLMHSEGDIFRSIAARLYSVSEEMVNDDMRQRAKQLCYAMIYGMGMKSLAESLSVSESEAKDYFETFMGTYKGIRSWLKAVAEQARNDGYVSTLTGRRRVLSGINSEILVVKAQAERQAVNTKVQGSAADIAKKAMVLIEKRLQKEFSYLPVTFPTTQSRRNLRSSDLDSRPRGAYLLLQLHDELLFEVNSNDLQLVANIVKESMEHAFELRVPLPVKVKVGTTWGNLEDYKV